MKNPAQNLLQNIPQTKQPQGFMENLLQCSNGCIIPENDIHKIHLEDKTIKRCPYCNCNKLKKINGKEKQWQRKK